MRFMPLLAMLVLVGCAHANPATPPASPAHALAHDAHLLVDACVAADWERALNAADIVRTDEARVRGLVAAPALLGMVDDALPLTESAAGRRARRSCQGAAAAVALAASKMDADDREELTGWLRRINADAQYRDFDAARRDVAMADGAWARVRPHVDDDTVATVDAAIAATHGSVLSHAARPMRHAAHAALNALHQASTR
ncbi:MAG TPA: hypothetical protein VF765_30070 [Polyangiaceae bacterium]